MKEARYEKLNAGRSINVDSSFSYWCHHHSQVQCAWVAELLPLYAPFGVFPCDLLYYSVVGNLALHLARPFRWIVSPAVPGVKVS